MQPRLEAEETLDLVTAIAAGTGSLKEETARPYVRGLTRQALGGRLPAPARVEDIQALGIAVEQVPVEREPS